MKKYLSIMLSIVLVCVMTLSVNAKESKKDSQESVIFSAKAISVNESIKEVLRKSGARINDASIVKVLKVEESEDTAICITNIDEEELVNEVFMAFTKDESGKIIVDNSMASALTRSSIQNMQASFPPTSWGEDYVIHATATAERYIDTVNDPYGWAPYYRPYQCSFYYSNYDDNNLVFNRIDMRYVTSGIKYSYPDYEYIGPTDDHVVRVNVRNPAEATFYSSTNHFVPSNNVLSCIGADNMVLTFTYWVNGTEHYYSVKLTGSY